MARARSTVVLCPPCVTLAFCCHSVSWVANTVIKSLKQYYTVGHKKHTKILLCTTSANVDRFRQKLVCSVLDKLATQYYLIYLLIYLKRLARDMRCSKRQTYTSFHFNLSKKKQLLWVLRGSVATLFRWSWKILSYFAVNLSVTLHISFYQNRSSVVVVMTKKYLVCFYAPQCSKAARSWIDLKLGNRWGNVRFGVIELKLRWGMSTFGVAAKHLYV